MRSSADLYNLTVATAMQRGDTAERAPTRLIQEQIDQGFVMLRFNKWLERDFHRYLRESSSLSRASLIVLIVSGILACALLDASWLGLPSDLVVSTRITQFVVMFPMALVCLFLCLRFPSSAAMEVGLGLLFLIATAGLLGQRVIDARAGFDLPLELIGVVAVAMLCLSRLRLWVQVPLLVGVAVVTLVVEMLYVPLDSAYDLFTTALFFVVALIAGYAVEHNIRWTWLNGVQLRYLSRLDALTGLLNRHALEVALEHAHDHARRDRRPYAVAMVDIDAFGAYNNHYGHQYGDRALEQVADALAVYARRPMDCCGRYGGEEFALLWMDCDPEQARTLAESLREVVERQHIAHAHSPAAPWVTVSVGLCHVGLEYLDAPMESVLHEADRQLFQAKADGRNRVGYTHYRGPTAPDARAGLALNAAVRRNEPAGAGDAAQCGRLG